MSSRAVKPAVEPELQKLAADQPQNSSGGAKNYKGFVAGVFSGIAKLSGESHLDARS
jgi:hypothetical protein